jgi:hypothetical protein
MIFKRFIATLSIVILSYYGANGQNKNVGIGTPTPHPSAIVHLDDKTKGLKIPYTDTNAVLAYVNSFTPPIPIANGLLIYQKGAEAFYYYDSPKNKWIPLSGVTGPTGIRGVTGPTGLTGPTGFSSDMRLGTGFPVVQPGDTCGSYYIDLDGSYLYRYKCPMGPWMWIGGPFKSRIKQGETVHLSSKTIQWGREILVGDPLEMDTINGLSYNVVAPIGYTAYAWITAYGAVRKVDVNDD